MTTQTSQNLIDAFLSQAFNSVPVSQTRRSISEKAVTPDASGKVYEIKGICGTTLDICSSFEEAKSRGLEYANKRQWQYYEIWAIGSNGMEKKQLEVFSLQKQNTAVRLAYLHATKGKE